MRKFLCIPLKCKMRVITSDPQSDVPVLETTNSRRNPSNSAPSMYPFPGKIKMKMLKCSSFEIFFSFRGPRKFKKDLRIIKFIYPTNFQGINLILYLFGWEIASTEIQNPQSFFRKKDTNKLGTLNGMQ